MTTTRMPESPSTPLPPTARLAAATLAALAAAAVLLVTIVWPAEFGRDPSGVGRALGIFRPAADEAVESEPSETGGATASTVLVRRSQPFRGDEMSVTLQSGEGAEIKAEMGRGQRMVFSWTAVGGGVDVDMHADAGNGEATSYWKDEGQTSGHGAYEAAFAGNHGWFWQNLNDTPVTITVKVVGYHDRLLRP